MTSHTHDGLPRRTDSRIRLSGSHLRLARASGKGFKSPLAAQPLCVLPPELSRSEAIKMAALSTELGSEGRISPAAPRSIARAAEVARVMEEAMQ